MEFDKCSVCGRRLYTERSRKIGIGPTCLKKTMTKLEVNSLLSRFPDIEAKEVKEGEAGICPESFYMKNKEAV